MGVGRWWGVGRRQAREAARVEAVRRQRELVDGALEQARRYPHTHIQRWSSLEPLGGVSSEVVTGVAVQLIRSGVEAEVVLGAQVLDRITFGRGATLRPEGELVQLLDQWCRPDGDPDVIGAALGVWLEGDPPDAQTRLEQLLTHPSPTVRARAGFLYAAHDTPPAPRRLIRLAELLDQDGNPQVREQVADGLLLILRDAQSGDPWDKVDPDPQLAADVAACLRRHRQDPSPAVRAIVFTALSRYDADPDLDWLLRELADPDVRPGFVSAVTPSLAQGQALAGKRADIEAALDRLDESGWAERVTDGDYPGPVERLQALDEAIDAVTD